MRTFYAFRRFHSYFLLRYLGLTLLQTSDWDLFRFISLFLTTGEMKCVCSSSEVGDWRPGRHTAALHIHVKCQGVNRRGQDEARDVSDWDAWGGRWLSRSEWSPQLRATTNAWAESGKHNYSVVSVWLLWRVNRCLSETWETWLQLILSYYGLCYLSRIHLPMFSRGWSCEQSTAQGEAPSH